MGFNKFKFVFLGSCNTGKTCIVYRYINKEFLDIFQSTIGGAFVNKAVSKDDIDYILDIWDTAGQERYRSLLPMYYRNSDIVFLCFDLTEKVEKIKQKLDFWIKQLDRYNDKSSREILLIGTKVDLVNDIILDEKTEILREQYKDFTIISTSSKDNINIDEIFDEGLQKAINNNVKFKDSEDPSPLNKLVLSTEVKSTTWRSYCNIL